MRYSEKQGLSSSTEAERSRYQLLPPSKEQGTGVLALLGPPGAPTQVSEAGAITANGNSFQLQGYDTQCVAAAREDVQQLVLVAVVLPPAKLAAASLLPDFSRVGVGLGVSVPHVSPMSAWFPRRILWKPLLLKVGLGTCWGCRIRTFQTCEAMYKV